MQTRSSPSIEVLHNLAREAGIKMYHRIPKTELYRTLQKQYDLDRLQRAQSRRGKSKAGCKDRRQSKERSYALSKGKRRTRRSSNQQSHTVEHLVPSNSLDPIMLTELGEHRYNFVRSNGTVIQYNVETLVEYFLTTGDFSEPETRIQFTDDQLSLLDMEAKKAGLKTKSVVEAKKHQQIYLEKKIQRDGVLGLERCAGELVTEMLNVIENCDPEEGEMRFVMNIFPHFSDLYRQLAESDGEYANQCIKHFVQYIKGPPNHPTVDHYGFLDVVLNFFNEMKSGTQSCKDYGF